MNARLLSVIVILTAGLFLISGLDHRSTILNDERAAAVTLPPQIMPKAETTSKTGPTSRSIPAPDVTIYFDNFGFDPNEATVPVGSTVTFVNISSGGPLSLQQVDWWGYPIEHSPFDISKINEGQSASFVVTHSGVWQYEANNDPSLRGELGTGPLSIEPYMDPNGPLASTTKKVVYDIFGFMPNEVSVPAGTTLTLTNITNDSQPGPSLFGQAAGEPPAVFLNIGILQKGASASITPTYSGTWRLENLDQPAEKAFCQISAY